MYTLALLKSPVEITLFFKQHSEANRRIASKIIPLIGCEPLPLCLATVYSFEMQILPTFITKSFGI
jgi:hypothetical protein